MSASARTSKPLERKDFAQPRTLPPRAIPSSEEARLLGPFSKRREVNIRWRFFRHETQKILPPFEVAVGQSQDREMDNPVSGKQLPMQHVGILRSVEELIGDPFPRPPMTRRERHSLTEDQRPSDSASAATGHPSRWVKRRYRTLLGKLPQLVYGAKGGLPKIQLSSVAHISNNPTAKNIPPADPVTNAWLGLEEKKKTNK
ncbi:hypothetical protein CPC08DRAFT_129830 [Agrocybe pediades]|nr:hypothetical protein CPC08DRAFT_129830 [Agrocybe pediades]